MCVCVCVHDDKQSVGRMHFLKFTISSGEVSARNCLQKRKKRIKRRGKQTAKKGKEITRKEGRSINHLKM